MSPDHTPCHGKGNRRYQYLPVTREIEIPLLIELNPFTESARQIGEGTTGVVMAIKGIERKQ